MPWDEDRLSAVEAEAKACPSGDACAADVVSLVAEVRRLRVALQEIAEGCGHARCHAHPWIRTAKRALAG